MKHTAFLPLGIVIALIVLLSFQNISFTGKAVDETTEKLTLKLEQEKVAKGENVQGTLTLKFNETVSPDEQISVTIDGKTTAYKLKEFLAKENYSIEYAETILKPTNGETKKQLQFTSTGSKYLGFEVPRFANVTALSFDLDANSYQSSYPSSVTIDMGGEGKTDWFYIGEKTSYSKEKLTSEDFDGSAESVAYINDDSTYFCEIINFPQTKHLTINAEYEKKSSVGDISAVVLSFPSGDPELGWAGGGDTCDLPETSGSCTVTFLYPIEGEHLVCVHSTEEGDGENLYELPIDFAETDTAFTCPTSAGSYCKATDFSNFFISAYAGEYDVKMQSKVDVLEWEMFRDALLTGVQNYVGTEPYKGVCKQDLCTVPVNITSATAGSLTVSNFLMHYTYGNIAQDLRNMYDLSLGTANITTLEAQSLENGATIDINLNLFGISEASIGKYTLTISFMGKNVTETIDVVDESEILDTNTFINLATERYTDLLDTDSNEYQVLLLLDKTQEMKQALKELEDLRVEIGFVDDEEILQSSEEIINDLPWDIAYAQTSSKGMKIEPSEIPSGLGDVEALYSMQDAIKVTGTKRTVQVQTYARDVQTYTMIEKKITAEESFSDAAVYEIAPVDFSNILSNARPTESNKNQIVYTISLDEGENEEYFYLMEDDAALDDFKTIIVLSQEETTCGDSICSLPDETIDSCPEDCKVGQSIWLPILGIVLLAVSIILFIRLKPFKKKV